ncbi:pLS20_p028 family conjugation system transmembrane protein [Clostridium tertium]|uniref:pLS20_p028 family conjugation system transmembrane protein n=2 Tax=Clostridium tertium TaxID=1559 RepID=UPI00374F0B5E
MEILEKLMQNNILEMAGIISNCIRWVLWKIVTLLSLLVNSIEKAVTKIYNINGFFNSPEVTALIDKYKPLVWVILAISIGILGFKIMFNRKQNRGELPSNILFSILILVLLPTLMTKLDNMTSIAVKDVASEYTSSANELIKNNIYDLYYLDSNGFDLNNKNSIKSSEILTVDANETIDLDEVNNKAVLGKKIRFDKNGNKKLEDLETGWFKIDEEYYRYGIDFLSIIVTLGAMGITLICIGLKVARLIFELAFNKLLATLFAFADIGDGKKLKEIIKHIFSMFIVIFSTAIMTKLYVIFSSWLGTSLGNAGLSANGVAKMIVLVGGSIAVIDGPNIIERILGIDAGLKNGWSAVMAGYGLSKGAMNGLSSLSEGVKSLGKATALGASMGAGALSGMFGKDKNSNIINDDDNTDKNNNDKNNNYKNNVSNNDIEQDMKNSDSNKNENPNVADNKSKEPGNNEKVNNDNISNIEDEMNRSKNRNSNNIVDNKDIDSLKDSNKNGDLNSIEEEMNRAKNSNPNNDTDNNKAIPNDINSKNMKDINRNRDNNMNVNNIEEEMNKNKNINPNNDIANKNIDTPKDINNPKYNNDIEGDMQQIKGINTNKSNLDSVTPKDSLNDEMSDNKGINPNKGNLDGIRPKDSLNDEMSDNKGINPNRGNLDGVRPKGSLNDEMSDNKSINPNKGNLDGVRPKGGLNDEISDNKDINSNRSNVDNVRPKDSLNTEIGKSKDSNSTNSDNINSKNGFENIRPKEADNTSNSKLDNSNNRTREENLVGKMENRTIGEYAKDKVKSSKFIDDLNRSYNLGKNSTNKWNIKRKKNKI